MMLTSWRKSGGIALILVLWVTMLLAIVAGSYSMVSRTDALQARNLFDSTRALLAAEAGLHSAVARMRHPDFEQRWFADGRPYRIQYQGAQVTLRVTDENGKLDINVAGRDLLQSLFEAAGEEVPRAEALADAVIDWRDPDDMPGVYGAEDADYEAQGYAYGAKDAPFATVEELQQVLGVDYELYQSLQGVVTVFSGRAQPDPSVAPPLILRALPQQVPQATIEEFVAAREAGVEDLSALFPELAGASRRGGGFTYTIYSDATLENGARGTVRAVVRATGAPPGEPAFAILRWQQGYAARQKPNLSDVAKSDGAQNEE